MNKETEHLLVMMHAKQLLQQAQPSALSRLFPPKPLTRTEKMKRRFSVWKQRVTDAWAMLRGEYDCGC